MGKEILENKRERVRKALIDPLVADGMRFKAGTPIEIQKKRLAQMADDLAYMSDRGLASLVPTLRQMGEGAAKCFWPQRVTIIGLAHTREPAPFEDDPNLVSWFQSAAGREAKDDGRAVAEYLFFKKHHRPPLRGDAGRRDRKAIADRAQEFARKAELIRDRCNRDVDVSDDDMAWLQWFEKTEARVFDLIRRGGAHDR